MVQCLLIICQQYINYLIAYCLNLSCETITGKTGGPFTSAHWAVNLVHLVHLVHLVNLVNLVNLVLNSATLSESLLFSHKQGPQNPEKSLEIQPDHSPVCWQKVDVTLFWLAIIRAPGNSRKLGDSTQAPLKA